MRKNQNPDYYPDRSPFAYVYILLAVMCGTSAALFSKKAALVGKGIGLIPSITSIWYLGSLICLGLLACFWILVLRKFPLSYAYPFMSSIRGLVLLGAWMLFHEQISSREILGIFVVMSGIAVIGRAEKE